MYAQIALKTTFSNSLLTYQYENLSLVPGMTVTVPLQKRVVTGTVIYTDIPVSDKDIQYKNVISICEDVISFSQKEIQLLTWIADYYHYPLGLLIHEIKPKELKRPRAINFKLGQDTPFEFTLNPRQKEIISSLKTKMDHFHQSLIHGITGSGKTAIYIELIKEVIQTGKSVLFLLPEINLTPQFLKTLSKYLNCKIYSYHSAISNSDKFALWKMAQEQKGEPFVVLGVRSSVFVPINNLGLIVVDEEHDPSFKQEERCPYNARDIAIKKAASYDIPIVLGSATPSFESYARLNQNDQNYFPITERVGNSTLPQINVLSCDVDDYEYHNTPCWPFVPQSLEKIQEHLEKNEQILVFVNRLGHANYLMCKSCGHQFLCPNCSTTLRFFKNRNELSCNICDFKQPPPSICPECSNMVLSPKGYGTELLEQKLKEIFPSYTTKRLDRDEIKTLTELKKRLDDFHNKKIDILVGTQMLSKGHNFESVNLVVVMGLDSQLNYPDHRANERVFQLLKQVSGRSGRYADDGEVIVQTYSSHHPIFEYAKDNSSEEFYGQELKVREITQTPPYDKIIALYINSHTQHLVISEAEQIKRMAQTLIEKHYPDVECLGPRPSIIEKKKNLFSWTLLLKSKNINQLHQLTQSIQKNLNLHSRSQLRIDVDPYCIY